MRIDILTIFPEYFAAALESGMIRIARERGMLRAETVNLRDFTSDRHRTTDDAPFGGGAGMVMVAEPIFRAVGELAPGKLSGEGVGKDAHVVILSPQGQPFEQSDALRLSKTSHLVLICGRYKGVDERVSLHLADEEISVGDFVLSGGEPAALCVLDAIARLLPGVLGDFDSAESDSFQTGLLDCAYYTRPAEIRGHKAPEVLLSGDHGRIAEFRRQDALRRTWERRPELLERAQLSREDRQFLSRLERDRQTKKEE